MSSRRRGLRRWLRSALPSLVILGTMSACSQLPGAAEPAKAPRFDDRLAKLFPDGPQPEAHDYLVEGRSVHYLVMPGGPQRVLFIHGTPGNWQGWHRYLADPRLRERATLIAVDRPGFSNSGSGQMVPALADQSRLLAPLLGNDGHKTWLVGHSLGGPIAAKMAMDYPDQVAGVLMLAPSISPALEHPRWFNHLADTWLARSLKGTWFQRLFADDDLFNSNDEIMPLVGELAVIEPDWARLTMPLVVVQGMKDKLVSPRTADYAEQTLPKLTTRVIRLPEDNHFLIWNDYPYCSGLIVELLDQASPP